jgi:hypothetical protein
MVMFRIPGTRGLMKAADPKDRFWNELETHLKPFEIAFVRGYVVLAENTELVRGCAKHQVGVDPGVGASRVSLAGPMKCLSRDEDFEIAGGMIVLRDCQVGREPTQGGTEQNFWEAKIGHLRGSRRACTQADTRQWW